MYEDPNDANYSNDINSNKDVKSSKCQYKISAVICTYNRYDILQQSIGSLVSQRVENLPIEVIIVDNSSDLSSQNQFWNEFSLPDQAKLIIEKRKGLSRARNIGLKSASAPLIAYIDDDAIAEENWASAIVNTFETMPDSGAVGGPVIPIWSSEAPSWLHQYLKGFLTIVDYGSELKILEKNEWLAGTNIAFRTADLVSAGGFDETLGRVGSSLLSNEELVLLRKVLGENRNAYYVPAARVRHRVHLDRTSHRWMRQRVAWQAVSDMLAESTHDQSTNNLWNNISIYQNMLSPEMRGIRGLFLNTDDPVIFEAQCTAVGSLINLLMGRAIDPEEAI